MLETIFITGELQAYTPLHIGSGEFEELGAIRSKGLPPAVERDTEKLESQVAMVVRAADKNPCIPATTLKGCLLSAALQAGFDRAQCLDALFGKIAFKDRGQGTQLGKPGRLRFHLSKLIAGSLPKREDHDLPFYDPAQASYILTRVAIDRQRGTAKAQHLFNQEMVPAGTRFTFALEFDGPVQDFMNQARQVIKLLRAKRGISLGKGQGLGQGRVRLLSKGLQCKCTSFNPANFDIEEDKAFSIDWAAPGELNLAPVTKPQITTLELFCRGPYLISDPYRAGDPGNKCDPAIKGLQQRPGEPLLLPSSLLGVLRSRMAWLQALAMDHPPQTLEDVDDPARKPGWKFPACISRPDCPPFGRSECLTTTERLFGVTGWRRLIEVEDIELRDEECKPERCELTSVALDRFTGGPLDGALFTTEAYRNIKFLVRLRLTAREFEGEIYGAGRSGDEMAFSDLITDLESEGLILGHGGTKGFGWFEVSSKKEVADA